MKKRQLLHSVWACALFFLLSNACTKLDTKVYDQVTNFWKTDEQIAAGVAPAYAGLRSYAAANEIYSLNELSSDEIIVPTRGADWYDNGMWEEMWMHSWTPSNALIQSGWQFIYGGVARINQILKTVELIDPRPANFDKIEAELKTIRAFYYYIALDLFGNVPIVESNDVDLNTLVNKSRKEVFAFIEKELKANIPNLTDEVNPQTYGRATKWFGYAILAKLYLNSEVYTGTAQWPECISACDLILKSGYYTLEEKFFHNFSLANEDSRENIFAIPFDPDHRLEGLWLQIATLHYDSNKTFGILGFGGANGHCSTAEFYNLFAPNDERRKMFLVGQQYVNQIVDSAHMQYDMEVNIPLSFDPEIKTFNSPYPKARVLGARCAKWEFDKTHYGSMGNDWAVYRLADIILMKAEAQYMMGDAATALETINAKYGSVSIRSRVGLPDFPASEMTKDGILNERARELAWEGFRRNDMIRLGHFTDPRIPEKLATSETKKLYPIPKAELDKNPNLVQNPGY